MYRYLGDIWFSGISAFNQTKNLGGYYEFIGFLSDWFIGHTIYEDQKLFKKII